MRRCRLPAAAPAKRTEGGAGFVAGYWVRVAENRGTSVIAFESEEAARGAADRIVTPPSEAATVDSVEVGEVVAHARWLPFLGSPRGHFP
jgi:hypothetical protein